MQRETVHIRNERDYGNTRCNLNWAINMIGNVEPSKVEAYRARPDVKICVRCDTATVEAS